jgi:hypothetical protein
LHHKDWIPVWQWATGPLGHNRSCSVDNEIFFPHRHTSNGTFITPNGIAFNASMWGPSQPNNLMEAELCIFCCRNNCNDRACRKVASSLCLFEDKHPLLELRGFCSKSLLDRFYYPASHDGQFYWIGTRGTIIAYNQTTFQWIMRLYGNPNVIATAEESFQSLLLGRSTWTVSNDRGCSSTKDFTVNISFSSCLPNEYACDDGLCIDLKDRCDGFASCSDGSDEIHCQTVKLAALYNKLIPPPNITVKVLFHIRSVLDIEVREGKVHMTIQLNLKWYDPRLSFYNLKEKASLNILSEEEYEALWRPLVIYRNIEPTLSHLIEEPVITLRQKGNSTLSGNELAERATIFAGNDTSLQWSEISRYLVLSKYILKHDSQLEIACAQNMVHSDTKSVSQL